MKRNIINAAILILIITGISSCASTKNLVPADISNNAKNLTNPENKALVYIYRISSLGFAVGLGVDCNNKELATLYPKRYYFSVLDPGKYVFTGHGENEDDIILTLEKDKKYYIEVTPQMGWVKARCKLTLIDPAEGSGKVLKCQLVGMNPDAQKLLKYTPTK